jgi:signal transduction histidine kinase
VERAQTAPDLSPFQQVLPEGSGVVVYVRALPPPWTLRAAVGDGPGVLGIPNPTICEVWQELVHPDDEPGLATRLASLRPGEALTMDYRVRTPIGGERWVRDSVKRLPGGGGFLVGTLRDVSLERTLRAQITALEERIWQAQRVDSLGGLAAGIAHDLGNLLTAVVSAVQLVEESEGIPPSAREDLVVARESARRGSEFVKQILRFAARGSYRPGPVDLNAIVEDLRVILGRSLGTDVRLLLRIDPDLPRVHCDPGQMEQVLLNLAVNAREAMPGGGRLTISTRVGRLTSRRTTPGGTLAPGDYVILSVSDNGRGIPDKVRQRIFEPFFSTKARADAASGFGLSTVQRIVQDHGGGIDVESTAGEGTSFHIYMPMRAVGAAADQEGARRSSRDAALLGRVLIVEADPSAREVMRRVLAQAGYGVIAAGSARESLQLFDRVRPQLDLLLTGLVLPDRSGFELVRLLRNRVSNLPVVYVAGAESRTSQFRGEDPGGVFLHRPFTPRRLLEVVEHAISAGPGDAREAEGSKGA